MGIKRSGQSRSGSSDQAADCSSRISLDASSRERPATSSRRSFVPAAMVRRAPKSTRAQIAAQLSMGRRKIAREGEKLDNARQTAANGRASVVLHNHTRAKRSAFGSITAAIQAFRRLTDRGSAARRMAGPMGRERLWPKTNTHRLECPVAGPLQPHVRQREKGAERIR